MTGRGRPAAGRERAVLKAGLLARCLAALLLAAAMAVVVATFAAPVSSRAQFDRLLGGSTEKTPASDSNTVSGGTSEGTALADPSTVAPPILPDNVIGLSQIFEQADRALSRLDELAGSIPKETPERVDAEAIKNKIESSAEETRKQFADRRINVAALELEVSEWRRRIEDIDRGSRLLGDQISVIQGALAETTEIESRWQSTKEAYKKADIQGAPVERIEDVLARAAARKGLFNKEIAPRLEAQKKLSELRVLIKSHIDYIEGIKTDFTGPWYAKDKDSIFSAGVLRRIASIKAADLELVMARSSDEFLGYIQEIKTRLSIELVILLAVWLFLRPLLSQLRERTEDIPRIDELNVFLGHPFLIALLLMAPLAYALHPDAPLSARNIFSVIMVLPVIVLLANLIAEKSVKRFIVGLGACHIIGVAYNPLVNAPPLDRLVIVVQALAGIALVLATIGSGRLEEHAREQGWEKNFKYVKLAYRLLLAMLAVVLAAQALGYNRAGVMVGRGTFNTIYLSLLALATYRLVRNLLVFALYSERARKVRTVRDHRDEIRRMGSRALGFLAFGLWLYMTASVWGVYEPLASALGRVLDAGVEIGQAKVTLGLFLSAMLAIYVSIKISRLVSAVLEAEVYSRKEVDHGLRSAIQQVVRYVLVFIGFVVALGLVGVRLESLAIVAGALGVGIGFGLQNVVNNFVAGLIMLAERPIKVGDVLQVDGQWVEVRSIGIRSTIIETWDRSEIIVPNGDLLWSNIVNWTHTNKQNRIIISVGVAYGSDVEKVLEILRGCAEEHPEVLTNPEPVILFMGFGDSSLDFEVRCYLPKIDGRLRVASEVRAMINAAFEDNDIVIPFPQRDLWVKQWPPAAMEGAGGGEEPGPSEKTRAPRDGDDSEEGRGGGEQG